MTLFQSVIMGIVEGLTEFLPISSTGHLMLTAKILNLNNTDFLTSFEISIQLGAILAVIFLYWKSFICDFQVIKKVTAAFIPTAVLGVVFYKIIKKFLLVNTDVVLYSLFIGGIILIIFELFHKEEKSTIDDIKNLNYKQAFFIGVCQSFAMIPGVSRAAATIIGGLAAGLKRKTIVEFSFLLAIPTMAGAAGLDLIKSGGNFSVSQIFVLTAGFLVSFIVAILGIKFLLNFIKKNNFVPFGIYRILVAVIFFFIK